MVGRRWLPHGHSLTAWGGALEPWLGTAVTSRYATAASSIDRCPLVARLARRRPVPRPRRCCCCPAGAARTPRPARPPSAPTGGSPSGGWAGRSLLPTHQYLHPPRGLRAIDSQSHHHQRHRQQLQPRAHAADRPRLSMCLLPPSLLPLQRPALWRADSTDRGRRAGEEAETHVTACQSVAGSGWRSADINGQGRCDPPSAWLDTRMHEP